MTGYANATLEASQPPPGGGASASVSVEMRAVNGRFLDLALRLPDDMRALEPALRELVGANFRRGKIELRVTSLRDADSAWPAPGADGLSRLGRLEALVRAWLPEARALSVNEALLWCRGSAAAQRLDETVLAAARQCATALREARAREGARLVEILLEKLQRLRELAAAAEPLIPQVLARQQARFVDRWNEALAAAGGTASIGADGTRERALGEAAAYAMRIDVAEELARLRAHLDEVERLLRAGGELGKRLDFLIQELQREANTLGSKSAALELTNLAVEMKVLVEQLREQVQNIE